MSLATWIDFPDFGDQRGGLVAIEGGQNIPFDVKRVYYIYDTKLGTSRGFHAHKTLRQVAVCVAGKCTMLLDNGSEQIEVCLDAPNRGILIDSMVWREMHHFSSGCVLLVIASEHYDEDDYIRDYERFKELIHG